MKNQLNRRKFIKTTTITGLSGCALLMAAKLNPIHAFDYLSNTADVIIPKELNYCGYKCPADCLFLKATREDDVELKKQAYDTWNIKERHGLEFDEEKIICWGCKAEDKPLGVVTGKCTVRGCAIEKGFEACIECGELKNCNKDLWTRFPDFHKSVIEMQESYKK